MSAIVGIIFLLLYLGIVVLMFASLWRLFVKAGRKGWEGIVPIYNMVVMCRLVGKPEWWVALMFIPYAGIVWSIWVMNLFIKKFGKTEGYTIGCIFLPFIFLPLLAFGDAEFEGAETETDSDILDADLV